MATPIIIMRTPDHVADTAEDQQALFDLLTWTSPAWPVGAFAFSGGLEWACEAAFLNDAENTRQWLETLITCGPLWNDAVFYVHAYRASLTRRNEEMLAIAELALACATSAERRLETTAQGAAFRRIGRATFGVRNFAMLDPIDDADLAYPVAFACLAAQRAVPIDPSLGAFLLGVVANLVSAAQRIVPLGQTDAQHVLRELRSTIGAVSARALALPDDDPFEQIAGSTMMADLGAMAHETQYTRLFRT